jgi:hypothetical protein
VYNTRAEVLAEFPENSGGLPNRDSSRGTLASRRPRYGPDVLRTAGPGLAVASMQRSAGESEKNIMMRKSTIVSITLVAAALGVNSAVAACLTAGSTGLTTQVILTSNQQLIGKTINATGCDLGIYIGPGTEKVLISGVTVTGANEHGIFVQDASLVTIQDSVVTGNGVAGHACPPSGPPPAGCIAEDKGIELVGTKDSVVTHNLVSHNSADGGIGVADDGPTDPGAPNTHPGNAHGANNDIVSGNLIIDNSSGCGIVIAAYNQGSPVENIQVFGNTIIGTAPAAGQFFPPAGSYIGQIVVATDGPFAEISNAHVIGNKLDGSELPGIVVHSNVFGDVITQTLIQGNVIADNGYYPGPPATSPNDPGVSQGTTGIALIAEIGGTTTPSPVLSHTNVSSNTILNDTNGVWLCGTDNTNIHQLQGNSTNSSVVCSAGGK